MSYNIGWKGICKMPRQKTEAGRYRFYVGMDKEPEVGDTLIKWARRLGTAYPADFVKMVFMLKGYEVAKSLGIVDPEDEKIFNPKS